MLLIMPVAMVPGIKFDIATPSEASSLAVVYGVVLSPPVCQSDRCWRWRAGVPVRR
jgi:TRAP-type C4-dicarboxylate transport system permease large subunit